MGLVVIDEEDTATLLVHRISADDIYQRQEGAWNDIFTLPSAKGLAESGHTTVHLPSMPGPE